MVWRHNAIGQKHVCSCSGHTICCSSSLSLSKLKLEMTPNKLQTSYFKGLHHNLTAAYWTFHEVWSFLHAASGAHLSGIAQDFKYTVVAVLNVPPLKISLLPNHSFPHPLSSNSIETHQNKKLIFQPGCSRFLQVNWPLRLQHRLIVINSEQKQSLFRIN